MVSEVLLFSYALLLGAVGIQIKDLRVPSVVRNNSGSAALLDCDYTLKPEELAAHSYAGLVVKWYFNSSPSPVYQWIPGQKPQDLGILKGKLDLKHRSSDHGATMYRALYIRNPTTELSGEYKCLVSTFDDEDFMTKKMVVFAPEKSLEFTTSKPAIDSVNLTCRARGVYPEPKMALFKDPDRMIVDDVQVETLSRQRSYDIVATKLMPDDDLDTPTVFACELRIPEASYEVTKSVVYYPGMFNQPNESKIERGTNREKAK
ncbi:uncharacterized protein LOC110828741 isoform X2 [Zootermopsis nevadensis]|uniref:uncharacterized protein LOC110828741 isoform X2 n=1 Tax=Zootermopsis nevadensis TaxID=136037 RepID=UPI000B8E8528|nr:uncharacterized protein LOC110828741 isoform X2 [Zootermopsis nevadensis]